MIRRSETQQSAYNIQTQTSVLYSLPQGTTDIQLKHSLQDMAATSIPEDPTTSMEDFISCCICFETFTDPKILNCHHTFCEPCLHKLPTPRGRLTCPACRQVTPLPILGGTKALTADFRVNQLIDKEKQKQLNCEKNQKTPKREKNCDFCEANAEVACLDCSLVFCSNCKEEHRSQENEDGHCLIAFTTDLLCFSHSNKLLVSFCYTCSHGLCKRCALSCCKTHICRKMSKYRNYKKELEIESRQLVSIIEALDVTQEEQKTTKATKKQFEGLIHQITETAKNRIQTLADEYLAETKRPSITFHDESQMSFMIQDHEILKDKMSGALLQPPWDLIQSYDDIKMNIAALSVQRLEILPDEQQETDDHRDNDIYTLMSTFKSEFQDVLRDINKLVDEYSNDSMSTSEEKSLEAKYPDQPTQPLNEKLNENKMFTKEPGGRNHSKSLISKQELSAPCQNPVYGKSGNSARSFKNKSASTLDLRSKKNTRSHQKQCSKEWSSDENDWEMGEGYGGRYRGGNGGRYRGGNGGRYRGGYSGRYHEGYSGGFGGDYNTEFYDTDWTSMGGYGYDVDMTWGKGRWGKQPYNEYGHVRDSRKKEGKHKWGKNDRGNYGNF